MGRLADAVRSIQVAQRPQSVVGKVISVAATRVVVEIDDVEFVVNGWSDQFGQQMTSADQVSSVHGRLVMVDIVQAEDTSSEIYIAYAIVIGV